MDWQKNVVSNWATLVDDFETSGLDFFERIEANIKEREVPKVTFKPVEIQESGALSDKRTYLRVESGELQFDIGAAKYGTGFFFSWWLIERPAKFRWLYTLGFYAVIVLVGGLYFASEGRYAGLVDILAGVFFGLVLAISLLGALGRQGKIGPERHIGQAPLLVGSLYKRFIAPDTYHSVDLVAMFQESIRRSVNDALDETLKQQGKQALTDAQKELGGPFTPNVRK